MFFNGPVQNGLFTLDAKPGKGVGIRLAAALNALIGAPVAPHLWNTVTLDGDRRHHERKGTAGSRETFEADLVAAKYAAGHYPSAGVLTDTATDVSALALQMIQDKLRAGHLAIRRVAVATCRACGHLMGRGGHPCRACGTVGAVDRARLHLVADLAEDRPVLERSDVHASLRQRPKHLQNNVGNTQSPLILSRTRDHGIDLAPIGLPGLVLDPRVGVHVTVLAAARRLQAQSAVMTITPNAANHIAAHGQHFRAHWSVRLRYALHGRLPYEAIDQMRAVYEFHAATAEMQTVFEAWFLPLFALRAKSETSAGQLHALFKYFRRAWLDRSPEPGMADLDALRSDVRDGNTEWIMNRPRLTAAIATTFHHSQLESVR